MEDNEPFFWFLLFVNEREVTMIIWFKNLTLDKELIGWKPFIKNNWFRSHFMLSVYGLMFVWFIITRWFGSQIYRVQRGIFSQWFQNEILLTVSCIVFFIVLYVLLYLCHEVLHIITIYRKGDISITHSGIFLWIHTNAILSKKRFWIFMTLPILVLSVIPFILCWFVSGYIQLVLFHFGLVNLIIASSDCINSVLILLKPNGAVFCRGFYRK